MAGENLADLAKLETEFENNPKSEAFIPLAQAYIKKGRLVEAMVVCKKGIKANPDIADGRLIIANIYLEQAKHQKAIEELNNLLGIYPTNTDALRLLGKINLKVGKKDESIASFKKVTDLLPEDEEAGEMLRKLGVDYIPPSKMPKPPVESQPPPISSSAGTMSPGVGQAPGYTSQPPAVYEPPKKRIADIYHEQAERKKKPQENLKLKYTMYFGGALLVVLLFWVIYTWYTGKIQEEINDHMQKARSLFIQDSYAGYNEALEHYRKIYKLNKSHTEALSRMGFICAVLVGEFGGPNELLNEGRKYISEAGALEQNNPMLASAKAYLIVYGNGNKKDAEKILKDALKENQDSSLLHTTLGYVLLYQGNLNDALEELSKGIKPSEIRPFVALGLLAQRRSMYREAGSFFAQALQNDKNHIKSILNKGLLALIRGNTPLFNKEAEDALESFKGDLEKSASEREKTTAAFIQIILNIRNQRKGLDQLKEMVGKDKENGLYSFIAAREYCKLGMLTEAKDAIQKALRSDNTRPDFALEEAAILLAAKEYESARSRALRVQALDGETGVSLLLIGDAYFAEKNFEKALEYYEKAKREDTLALAHQRIAQTYLAMPKPDEDKAQASLEVAVKSLLSSGERRLAAESAVQLAGMYAKKNRLEEFRNVVQTAKNADPTYAPPYAMIGCNIDISKQEGKEAAKTNCEKYLQLDPRGDYASACQEVLKKVK